MAAPKEISDKKERDALKKGSTLEIYSTTTKKWYPGTIFNIKKDDKGEWLQIKFKSDSKELKTRDIQRYSNQIRVSSSKKNIDKSESKQDTPINQAPMMTLLNGSKIPILGYGVYQLSSTVNRVKYAIKQGYRHVDTAIFYGNEKQVGSAINQCGIDRKDLFVTTKLWSDGHGSNGCKKAVNNSLKLLNIGYIDLYLIHSPYGGENIKTYTILMDFVKKGQIKNVGVSNYGVKHIETLVSHCKKNNLPLPVVNQIELHPWLQQKKIKQCCAKYGIKIQSYSPLTKAQKLNELKSNKNHFIHNIAKKHNKTIAQVLLKWNLQDGNIVLVKSGNEKRINENFDMWNWELSDGEMKLLNRLDDGKNSYHCTWDPTDSNIDDF